MIAWKFALKFRNLRTLEVDTERAKHLIPHVPKGIPIVVESGIKKHDEIMSYKSLGVHSFLIGTALMKSEDRVSMIHSLLGLDKKWKKIK